MTFGVVFGLIKCLDSILAVLYNKNKKGINMTLILSPEEIRKREFWEPCQSKEELYLHIKTFLNVDLPQHTIDEFSTSNPLEFIWSIYEVMLTNTGSFRHVVACSRNQFKTLSSAIIHFYGMIHFRRECCQMAAIKSQSAACIKYIDKFLMIPEVAGYSNINNKEEKILTGLPINSFTDKRDAKLLVIVGTLKGTNSARASCFAGKTKVTVVKKAERKKGESKYRRLTIDGLYKRIMRGETWEAVSVNPKTLELEQKLIVAAARRINLDRLVLTVRSGKKVECTTEHPIAVNYDGNIVYEKAENLTVGDQIFTKRTGSANTVDSNFYKQVSIINTNQTFCPELFSEEDLIEGTLLGDGCVFRRKNKQKEYAGNAILTITKEMKAKPWLEFFVQKMQEFGHSARINDSVYSGYTGQQQLQLQTGMSGRLLEYRLKWYDQNGKKIIPADLKMTFGKLAVLLMDDSHAFRVLSTESFSLEENKFLASKINELVGYECAVVLPYTRKGKNYVHMNLRWPREHGDKYELLLKHIHDCYKYKDKRHTKSCVCCGKVLAFSTTENVCDAPLCRVKKHAKTVLLDEIVSIERKKANPLKRERWVYDIEVQDNHNFFANGILAHNCLINDEVELIDPDILSEAANIADPTMREGFDPISVYLSSRKFAGGPLQGLIDEAEKPTGEAGTDIKLHKWSLCDGMARCPESVHRPDEPKIKSLIHRDTLEILWDKEAQAVIEAGDNKNHIEIDAFAGCRTCGAFVVCQTRSTKQPGNSPSLRTAKFVSGRVRDVKDTKKIIAQILNWKPESTGLVYPTFTPTLHVKHAVEAYKWISGGVAFNPTKLTDEAYKKVMEDGDPTTKKLVVPTKRDLYKLMVQKGWKVNWGVDWGYTDPASIVICGFDRKSSRAFVLHAEMRAGYSNQDWATYICTNYGKIFSPHLVCPDLADGASPTYFTKLGHVSRDTKPQRIETGVSFVRSLLWNVATQTVNFCILDDKINMCLVEEMQNWSHLRTPTGYDFDKFDPESYTHTNDALRYLLDVFIEDSDVVLQAKQKKQVSIAELYEEAQKTNDVDTQIALAKKQMEEHFAKEHGLYNVFNDSFRVPFAVPVGTPLPSAQMVQTHIEENRDKKKGGFFYKF